MKPHFSRQARRQIAALAKKNPEHLDRGVEVVSHLLNSSTAALHKPEPLVGDLSGYWSVRLDIKNRLIYRIDGDRLLVASGEGHYSDR